MSDDDRSGFHPEKIAAVATSIAQMIEARGGPDGEFAQRMAQMIESGERGTTDDERRFLELRTSLPA